MIKRTQLLVALAALVSFSACSDSPTDAGNDPSTSYMPRTTGSTWTYTGDMNYTVTAMGDTTVNGVTWTKMANTAGQTSLLRYDNGSYLNAIEDDPSKVILFLKDNVSTGAKWQFSLPTPQMPSVSNTYDLELKGTGLTRTVEGKSYSNVAHVHQTLSMTFMGQTQVLNEGDYYYAKGVGFIESNLGAMGGNVRLKSYSIK